MLVAAIALAWSLWQPIAPTTEPEETAAARAQRHFEAEQWDEAIEALIEAYAEDPDPAYLYARAQAERMRGNCKPAIELYRRFLASNPSPTQRADTERHVRLCEELLFQHEVEAAPKPPPPAETPPPPPVRQQPRRDAVAPALLGSGLVAVAAGMTIAIVGDGARRGAPDAATEDEYEDDGRRGTILLATGVSLAGVGGALIAGAIARFAVVSRRRRANASLGPALGLTVRTRF